MSRTLFFFTCCFTTSLSERGDVDEKEQFLREISFVQRIGSHRNLVSMIGYWHRSEPIMLIMEYVPHGDLLQWLRNKRQQVKLFCRFKTLVKNIDQMEG